VTDELTEKVARAILEDAQKSAEASGCDILLLMHEGHRAAARAAIRVVVEECAKVAEAQGDEQALYAWNEACDECANEIRKLAQDNNGEVA
jgi:gamma-glutamyl:cysteine ligase YbdK (ATP-grasp superfamily)